MIQPLKILAVTSIVMMIGGCVARTSQSSEGSSLTQTSCPAETPEQGSTCREHGLSCTYRHIPSISQTTTALCVHGLFSLRVEGQSAMALPEKAGGETVNTWMEAFYQRCLKPADSDEEDSVYSILSVIMPSMGNLDLSAAICKKAALKLASLSEMTLNYQGTFAGPTSLAILANHPLLTKFTCGCPMVTDLSPLSTMPMLEYVWLDAFAVTKWNDVSKMPRIKQVIFQSVDKSLFEGWEKELKELAATTGREIKVEAKSFKTTD